MTDKKHFKRMHEEDRLSPHAVVAQRLVQTRLHLGRHGLIAGRLESLSAVTNTWLHTLLSRGKLKLVYDAALLQGWCAMVTQRRSLAKIDAPSQLFETFRVS
jgi:hypothetical protein